MYALDGHGYTYTLSKPNGPPDALSMMATGPIPIPISTPKLNALVT